MSIYIFLMAVNSWAAVEPVLIRTLTEVTGGGLSVTGSTVTATILIEKIQSSMTITGGTGQQIVSATGTITGCSINPPVSNAEYDFEILTNDSDQFAEAGHSSIHGKSGLQFNRYLFGEYLFKIDNASEDGVYKFRCVIRR